MHIYKFWISLKWWQRCETDTKRWPVQISALLGGDRYSIPCRHLRALPLAHVLQWLTACPSSVALTYVHSVYYTLAQYIKPHPCSCLLYRRIVKSDTRVYFISWDFFSFSPSMPSLVQIAWIIRRLSKSLFHEHETWDQLSRGTPTFPHIHPCLCYGSSTLPCRTHWRVNMYNSDDSNSVKWLKHDNTLK